MKDLEWIKELVQAERDMEEKGVVDFGLAFNPEQALIDSTMAFLSNLKEEFIESCAAFNQLRGQPLGGVKIYGISRTDADFMLFRNGYKLIFACLQPGRVSVRFQNPNQSTTNNPMAARAESSFDEDILEAKWGAFGAITWTFDALEIQSEHLIKYYLQRFISQSST